MLNQKRVQEAINRIDGAIAQVTANRQTHLVLVNDLQIIQQCCKDYFDDEKELTEKKDVGTNKPAKRPKPGNKDK
jgi:hypothetical protein